MLKITSTKREAKVKFSREDAKRIGDEIGIDWDKYSLDELEMGMNVELEHGTIDSQTNITDDDPTMTFKISLIHIKEISDYYSRLKKMEEEGKKAKN